MELSQRGCEATLKDCLTIADLAGAERTGEKHVSEALDWQHGTVNAA